MEGRSPPGVWGEASALLRHRSQDGIADMRHGFFGQVGMDRQRQDAGGEILGDRQRGAVMAVAVSRL